MSDTTEGPGLRCVATVPSLHDLRHAVIELYDKLARFTWEDCRLHCDTRFGCCHELFCELAIINARELWGVTLEPSGHPTIPLLGPEGCVAAPHFRPVCAAHCCEDNPTGLSGGHRDRTWHLEYRTLKDYASKLETELVARVE